MDTILEVKNLSKAYGKLLAVNGLDLAIRKGSCFGLLGPNGAGKTTAIEVIEGVTAPTEGEILYKGKPRTAAFAQEVGIMFQKTALLAYLSVRETLITFKRLYHRSLDLDEMIAMCHLGDMLEQYNDRISGGQQQRVLLALAVINDPDLLFLDEPSTGLDPQARRNLWDIIQGIRRKGKTIVLTTHYMDEAQVLCDDIAIMDNGRIIARGSPQELIDRNCGGLTVILPQSNFKVSPQALGLEARHLDGRVEIRTTDVNACIRLLMEHQVDLSNLSVRSPNLEDVFLKLTGRQLRI